MVLEIPLNGTAALPVSLSFVFVFQMPASSDLIRINQPTLGSGVVVIAVVEALLASPYNLIDAK